MYLPAIYYTDYILFSIMFIKLCHLLFNVGACTAFNYKHNIPIIEST